ncbi:MAG: hypothetical protein WC642_14195 [Nocardioides sp.]
MAVVGGGDAQAGGQVGLAGAGSDSDRLQHLRAALPCEVRVTAATHPLFGLLLAAQHFRRVDGAVFLVVTLPDGSPGTIRADATDVVGGAVDESSGTVLDADGLRQLLVLVSRMQPPRRSGRARGANDK